MNPQLGFDASPALAALAELGAVLTQNPVACALLVLIVVPSLVGLFRNPALIERNLLRPHWLLPQREYATVVTSAFQHADLAHLFFNAFTFWAFGFSLERALGSGAFAALYAFGLAASAAGTWLAFRHDPGYRTLGASGAILAVLFASILVFPGASLFILPIPVPIPAPLFVLGYLGYTLWSARRLGGRINHVAHLGGAIAGVAFIALAQPQALAGALRHWLG